MWGLMWGASRGLREEIGGLLLSEMSERLG